MIEKIEISKELDFLLLPRHTVLVTVLDEPNNRTNIITLGWTTPVSHDPLIVGIAISPRRYSFGLIKEAKEFVINVPDITMAEESNWCGRKSGRRYDKFQETRFTQSPAKKIRTPVINECFVNLECRVVEEIVVGDHTTFFGEVVCAYARADAIKTVKHGGPPGLYFDPQKIKTLMHLGGDMYVTNEDKLVEFQVEGMIDV